MQVRRPSSVSDPARASKQKTGFQSERARRRSGVRFNMDAGETADVEDVDVALERRGKALEARSAAAAKEAKRQAGAEHAAATAAQARSARAAQLAGSTAEPEPEPELRLSPSGELIPVLEPEPEPELQLAQVASTKPAVDRAALSRHLRQTDLRGVELESQAVTDVKEELASLSVRPQPPPMPLTPARGWPRIQPAGGGDRRC